MAQQRSYHQYCPIARALDVIGDRWTLLILRELTMVGDLRFSDLRRNLPGVPPTLLTDRLRALTDEGLVTTRELPPPAARTVYTLTDRGREVIPVLRALSRFGTPLLEEPDATTPIRPVSAVHAMVASWYDAESAEGTDERYALEVDGEIHLLSSRRGGSDTEPVLRLTTTGRTLVDLRQGRLTLDRAVKTGAVKVVGPKTALRRFAKVFALR